MAWVEDTCVVVDLITGDPLFEPASSACLLAHLADGLVVSPVTFVETGPSFAGDPAAAENFLRAAQISTQEPWLPVDTFLAHRLWQQPQLQRRLGQAPKRPVADVLIAAFAARFQDLITRNPSDFHSILPGLQLVVP